MEDKKNELPNDLGILDIKSIYTPPYWAYHLFL